MFFLECLLKVRGVKTCKLKDINGYITLTDLYAPERKRVEEFFAAAERDPQLTVVALYPGKVERPKTITAFLKMNEGYTRLPDYLMTIPISIDPNPPNIGAQNLGTLPTI